MKKFIIALLIAILAMGILTASVKAQVPQQPAPITKMQLTPEQMLHIQAIQQAAREAIAAATTRQQKLEIMKKMQAEIQAYIQQCQQQKPNCMEQLNLTEEQKAAIEAIRQAAMAAARQARTMEERQNIMEKMNEDIMTVLTEEQIAQLEDCRQDARTPDRPTIGNCMSEIGLTAEQKATMDAIRKDALAAAEAAATREERQAILEKMQQDLLNVLDPNQLTALKECRQSDREAITRYLGRFDICLRQLTLTPEQAVAIQAIRLEARKALLAAQSATARQAIIKKMQQDIMAVLTDVQLAKLKQCMSTPPVMPPMPR